MAKKVTDYTALTTPADDDLMEIVDVSDNTMSPNGTNKKITRTNLMGAIVGADTTEKVLNVNCKVSAYLSATQENLVDSTWTKVLLDTENYDIGSDFASNKFTAPINGYYLVTAQITFINTVADKEFDLAIYKSGVFSYLTAVRSGSASSMYVPFAPRILYLTATQYLELYARAVAGVGTVDVIGGDFYTFLEVHLLSV